MVVAADAGLAVDRVGETVAVVDRPGYQQRSVYSELVYSDNRRHKEQVDLRPVLHPVKYSDTAYLWLNNTRRRYVSRTFYEPRVRPRTYSETTFARLKTAEQRFVSCLDVHGDEKRKWFKTSVEIKPRKFTSAKTIRSTNNNYIGTESSPATEHVGVPNGANNGNSTDINDAGPWLLPSVPNGRLAGDGDNSGYHDPSGLCDSNSSPEHIDPGASQVYIPQRLKRPLTKDCFANGDLLIDFVNGDLMDSGPQMKSSSSLSQNHDLL